MKLRQTLERAEVLKEFEEFELQGCLVRRFFTATIGHTNTEHP
jgi:hypothetical protein